MPSLDPKCPVSKILRRLYESYQDATSQSGLSSSEQASQDDLLVKNDYLGDVATVLRRVL